ncbi:MAG: hypothetical protein GY858_05585 [Candidatus Omnitrophica bacterium]|nr:hypothetical protein [Candidatus Omnitrophota bacterium]
MGENFIRLTASDNKLGFDNPHEAVIYASIKSWCMQGKRECAVSVRQIQSKIPYCKSTGHIHRKIQKLIKKGIIEIVGHKKRLGGSVAIYKLSVAPDHTLIKESVPIGNTLSVPVVTESVPVVIESVPDRHTSFEPNSGSKLSPKEERRRKGGTLTNQFLTDHQVFEIAKKCWVDKEIVKLKAQKAKDHYGDKKVWFSLMAKTKEWIIEDLNKGNIKKLDELDYKHLLNQSPEEKAKRVEKEKLISKINNNL